MLANTIEQEGILTFIFAHSDWPGTSIPSESRQLRNVEDPSEWLDFETNGDLQSFMLNECQIERLLVCCQLKLAVIHEWITAGAFSHSD